LSSPPSDDVTAYVVDEIAARFEKAQKPIVLIDACAGRFGMAGEVRKLVEGCQVRFFESEHKGISPSGIVDMLSAK
jgi:pyruvate decarboxylase